MAFNKLVIAALLATSSLVAVSAPTFAQGKSAVVCEQKKTADIVGKLANAKDAAERQAILAAALGENAGSAICIMNGVKAAGSPNAGGIFKQIIAVLSGDDANEPIIQDLMDQNPDMVAATAADVEPAAGEEGATPGQSFAPGTEVGGENPDQLNEPDASVSPVAPAAPAPVLVGKPELK